jgi:STE24 endopeptidase
MEDARRYEITRYIVSGVGFFINAGVLISLFTSGWTFRIRNLAEHLGSGRPTVVVLVYFAAIGLLLSVMQIPLEVFSGYYLEHRFKLSRQSFRGWMFDHLKGLGIGALLGLGAAEILYALLRHYPDRWWIYASAAFVAAFVVLANLAPVLILPLFFKFRPVENNELRRRVDRLARRTGKQVRGIFEWSLGDKTRKANAAVVGWGNTRRVIVSDTLLNNFDPEEIEVIMAHELCHHVKAHIWWGMALQTVVTFASFFAIHHVLRDFTPQFRSLGDVANFPIVALTIVAVSLLVLPLVNGFSRSLERAADRYAIDVTGDSLAFVSSMEKLADLNLANRSPNPIIEFLFYSHPSIENRIKLAADRVGQNV